MNIRFVVDRFEEDTAVLITDDNFLLEFPVSRLPKGTREGNVLDFTITQNPKDEAERRGRIKSLQEELLKRTADRNPAGPGAKPNGST